MDKIIKCSIYPKTTRFGKEERKVFLTEKNRRLKFNFL